VLCGDCVFIGAVGVGEMGSDKRSQFVAALLFAEQLACSPKEGQMISVV